MAIPALTVTFIKDLQQRIYWGHQDMSGEAVVMASTARKVDWTYSAYLERDLFAECGPRCYWIPGHDHSNLGC